MPGNNPNVTGKGRPFSSVVTAVKDPTKGGAVQLSVNQKG